MSSTQDARAPRRLAVWTDFGGVLTPPIAHTMGTFCTSQGIDPQALQQALGKVTARYGTSDIMEPIDTPLVSEEEWLAQVSEVLAADHGVTGVRLTTLADAWFDGRETNHAWVAALRTARERGAFVGMLSNMVPTWDAHWRRMVDPAELFDDVLLSFEVGFYASRRPACSPSPPSGPGYRPRTVCSSTTLRTTARARRRPDGRRSTSPARPRRRSGSTPSCRMALSPTPRS